MFPDRSLFLCCRHFCPRHSKFRRMPARKQAAGRRLTQRSGRRAEVSSRGRACGSHAPRFRERRSHFLKPCVSHACGEVRSAGMNGRQQSHHPGPQADGGNRPNDPARRAAKIGRVREPVQDLLYPSKRAKKLSCPFCSEFVGAIRYPPEPAVFGKSDLTGSRQLEHWLKEESAQLQRRPPWLDSTC
jgi:hypothetical protein